MFSRLKKYYVLIIYFVLTLFVVFTLNSFNSYYQNSICKGVAINMLNLEKSRFLAPKHIEEYVVNEDKKLTALNYYNLNEIENRIKNNPYIENVEVYKTLDKLIKIEVVQRVPIARVFNYKNHSFYIDKIGRLVPVSSKFSSRVMVFSGKIMENFDENLGMNFSDIPDSLSSKTLLDDIFRIANYVFNHDFWKHQIEQFYVNNKGDFEMYTKIGNHKIVLGKADLIEQKFNKLFLFYSKGLKKTGWNEFSEINLKYDKQIVCK